MGPPSQGTAADGALHNGERSGCEAGASKGCGMRPGYHRHAARTRKRGGGRRRVADLRLIPFTADIEAFEQLPRTARLARTTGKGAVAILNQATPNSRSEEDAARGVLDALGLPMAPPVLHRFKVHRDASWGGLTAQELEPGKQGRGRNWCPVELALCRIALAYKCTCAHKEGIGMRGSGKGGPISGRDATGGTGPAHSPAASNHYP